MWSETSTASSWGERQKLLLGPVDALILDNLTGIEVSLKRCANLVHLQG